MKISNNQIISVKNKHILLILAHFLHLNTTRSNHSLKKSCRLCVPCPTEEFFGPTPPHKFLETHYTTHNWTLEVYYSYLELPLELALPLLKNTRERTLESTAKRNSRY